MRVNVARRNANAANEYVRWRARGNEMDNFIARFYIRHVLPTSSPRIGRYGIVGLSRHVKGDIAKRSRCDDITAHSVLKKRKKLKMGRDYTP